MKRTLLALTCILLLNACKKEDPKKEPEQPATPVTPTPTPAPTGTLSGKVYHYDQFGTTYNSGLNTATVSVEGYSFTSVTDAAGHYSISGVPGSTYTIVFSKPGCGLIKRHKIIFKPSDTTTYSAKVADIPSFSLSNAYAKDTAWFSGSLAGIYYNASPSVADTNASVVGIVGKSPNLDLANPASYENYATSSRLSAKDFNRFLSYDLLKSTYTFQKDDILYLKIYPVSTKGAFYFDNASNTPVYKAYGVAYPVTFTFVVQ